MKTETKRYQTTIIVVYRKSYGIKKVSFDTLDQAQAVIKEQILKHPRSKKLNRKVFDSVEKRSIIVTI